MAFVKEYSYIIKIINKLRQKKTGRKVKASS